MPSFLGFEGGRGAESSDFAEQKRNEWNYNIEKGESNSLRQLQVIDKKLSLPEREWFRPGFNCAPCSSRLINAHGAYDSVTSTMSDFLGLEKVFDNDNIPRCRWSHGSYYYSRPCFTRSKCN